MPINHNMMHSQSPDDVAALKARIAELEEKKQETYQRRGILLLNCDVVQDYADDLKKAKHALWLARAKRAEKEKNYWYVRSCYEGDDRLWSIDGSPVKYIGCIKRTNFDWLKIWSEVESKCIENAEKYK